jgi:hypothetical protein
MQILRRELVALTILATALPLASGCGSSAPQATPTATPAAATTQPPATTSPATPANPEWVSGDLQLYFVPVTAAATPVGAIAVQLVIRQVHGGAQTTENTGLVPKIRGLWFEVTQLPPGRYRLKALKLRGPSLSARAIEVPTGGPAFTVPASGCAYIGLISLSFYRLPPGTLNQQGAVARQLAHGKTAYFVYLKTGGLLGKSASVGPLPVRQRPAGTELCPVHLAKF